MKRIGLILLLASVGAFAQQIQAPVQQTDLAERQAQIERLKAQEASLSAALEAARQKYSDNHPEIIKLRERLDQVRRDQVAQQPQSAPQQQQLSRFKLSVSRASPLSLSGPRGGGSDKWWNNPDLAASAGLTKDQQKKMDDVFLQYRLKLIDLNAALEREEVALEPLVGTDALDPSKIEPQIDRIAQARAELEKANGRMLLGIRMILTPEQWKKMRK